VPGKRFDLLACADGIALGRWTCDLCNTRDGPEQQSDVATVNIPTRGAFVRRGSGGTELVDPLTCSFSNVGEVWCSRHPEPCRDTGIFVTFGAAVLDAPFDVPYRRLSPADWLDWHRLAADARALGPAAAVDAARLLVERQLSAPPTPVCPDLVRDARAHVARGDIRSVDALAAELGVSVFTLCRAFRRAANGTALVASGASNRVQAWDYAAGTLDGVLIDDPAIDGATSVSVLELPAPE
jgi:hypothetical protein